MQAVNPVTTPGTAETKEEAERYLESPELRQADATAFRGLAARLNYLALDRPDLQFAAKGIAKRMVEPR